MKRAGLLLFLNLLCSTSSIIGQSEIVSHPSFGEPEIVMKNISKGEALKAILDARWYLTLSAVDHKMSQMYLNDYLTNSRVLIDEVPSRFNFSVPVSDDRRYISYFVKESTLGRNIGKIYDVVSGKLSVIDRPDGNVSGLYISSSTGKLSYLLENSGHVPRLYISDLDGSNSTFVDEALSGPWSPDGKWFLARRVSIQNVHPKARLRAGTITVEEFKRIVERERQGKFSTSRIWVFNDKGMPRFELSEFEEFSTEVWSPDGKKLAILTKAGEIYVLYFSSKNGALTVTNTNLCAKSEGNSYLKAPVWSPDCTNLAFIKCELDEKGHQVVNAEILIANLEGTKTSQVTHTPNLLEEQLITWSKEKGLLFIQRISNSAEITLSKIRTK